MGRVFEAHHAPRYDTPGEATGPYGPRSPAAAPDPDATGYTPTARMPRIPDDD